MVLVSETSLSTKEAIGDGSAGENMPDAEVEEDGQADAEVKLERTLSLLDAIMINIGIMIGSGIFISPKGVVAGVQSVGATLLVWVFAGIISLCGAVCYAELGTMITSSGGTYTYIRNIYGNFAGYITLWADTVIVSPASNAVMALLFSTYSLQPFYPNQECPPPRIAIKLLAVACVMLTMFINGWSVRWSSRLQNGTSFCNLLALAIIIISGMVKLGMGSTENFANPFESTDISGLGTALYSCLFSYSGWYCVNVFVEEIKNPSRNLPITMVLSLIIVTTVYTLANVAYFTVLSPSDLLASDAVAFSFADQVLGRFSKVFPVVVVLACFGCLNGSTLSSSRQFYVAGRDGHLPQFLAMVGVRHKTPLPSVILTSLITTAFCFVDSVFTLINFFGFVKWSFFGLAVAGLIVLRYKEPNRPRPFKVNIIIPIVFVIACVFLTIFGFVGAPVDSAIALAIIVSGIPIFFITNRLKCQPKCMMNIKKSASLFLQKVLLVTPGYSKETD